MGKVEIKADIFIYAVGYESRASHAVKRTQAESYLALALEKIDAFSYKENYAYATQSGNLIEAENCTFENILSFIQNFLNAKPREKIVIGVDVSSMTRTYMSLVLKSVFSLAEEFNIILKLVYTTGQYKPPPTQSGTYVDFKPIAGLEGWTSYPEKPLSVILGLGYEKDQAVGVVEYLDPSGTWAFVPEGDNKKFLEEVNSANESLWQFVEKNNGLPYRVDQPGLLYSELRSLVDVLSKRSRVVIVPGGPKIFSAIAILVGLEIGDEVSLWRASSHNASTPTDTLAEDKIIQFDYKLSLKNSTESDAKY